MKNFVIGVLLSLSCMFSAFAESETTDRENLRRSFDFSSGYFERLFNSNEGLVYFPLSAIQLYSQAFDQVTGGPAQSAWSRAGVVFLELPISYWVSNSLFVPYHEFGHARAQSAHDGRYHYISEGWANVTAGGFWDFSFWRLITPPFGFPGSGIGITQYLSSPSAQFSSGLSQYYGGQALEITRAAGGINNQMFLAKKISQLVYENNGHITYFQHYLGNKITGFAYSQIDKANPSFTGDFSDISALTTAYRNKGSDITSSDLETQSLVSLLSGTTASFIVGYANYIRSGDAVVRPLEVERVRVPDINSYINARGLSYEFVTGYRASDDLRFDLAYETIWKGESTYQVTPKVRYQLASAFPKLNDFWVSADVVIGKGIGGSLEGKWTPNIFNRTAFSERLTYFARLTLYNGYTLYGERNIPSFVNGKEICPELLAGVSYRY